MNMRIQSLNSNQLAYKSLQGIKKPVKRILPFAFATLLTTSLIGCGNSKKDTFEYTANNNTTTSVSEPGRIDNIEVRHFSHTGDAVYIKHGDKTTRIQFDNNGNLYGEYTNYKNEDGNMVFDTYHRLLNGRTSLDAYHVIQRGDKNTTIVECFDRDGDLIAKDSTVFESKDGATKTGCSTTYITLGNSKLNNELLENNVTF